MKRPLSILLIEDSEADAALLLHALRSGGFEPITSLVVETQSGMREALKGRPWDIITSDHALPEFSPPRALAIAKAMAPRVPFIIVSSEIELELAVSLLTEGAEDYVLKTQLARLPAAVDRSLRDSAMAREHLQSIDELTSSETRYRRLFEAAQDGILLVDPLTEQITDVNPFLMDMLGYGKSDFVGRKLWELGAFKDTTASKEAFRILKTVGYARYEDLPLVTLSGKPIAVEFVSNIYAVGDKQVIQCNIRDITDRTHAEAALKALTLLLEQRVAERTGQLEDVNKELEAFSYSVSHDLRAPLRQVDGFARILRDEYVGQGGSKARELVQRILASVQRMNALIDALLKLANDSTRGFQRRSFDLSALVKLAVSDLEQSDPTRVVSWVIAPGAEANADPELIRIVLDNLLGNAWKFTAGTPSPRIEFGFVTMEDGREAYFIQDNGVGFETAHASRMFGAFRRLHAAHEFAGLGIGLATVQRIVHRHGGRIWAEGAVGEGAAFWFTLNRIHPFLLTEGHRALQARDFAQSVQSNGPYGTS